MQITNVWQTQNTTAKFLDTITFIRPISRLTILEIKPIQFAKKKKKSLKQMK
jgi:hypothetical protein